MSTLSGKTIKTQSAERRDHRIPEVVFGCSQETKGYAQTALLKNPENGCIVPRVGRRADVLCADLQPCGVASYPKPVGDLAWSSTWPETSRRRRDNLSGRRSSSAVMSIQGPAERTCCGGL